MTRRSACLSLLCLAAAATFVRPATAQQVLGAGEDALTIPSGTFRIAIQPQWSIYSDAYGPTGTVRPVGAPLSFDSLGATQLPALLPLQTTLRSLMGNGAVNVSFGTVNVSANNRVQTVPIGVEYGISRWLQIGVTVPIVKTRASVSARVNTTGNAGNLAINPALGDKAVYNADTLFINQLNRAAAAVETYCTGAGAATPQCANGVTLATNAQTFGTGLQQVYADGIMTPTATSDIQTAINARATTFRTNLNTFAAIPGSGVTAISANGVIGAPGTLTAPGLQALLSSNVVGLAADSLSTIERTHLGDIEASVKFLLFDSFHGKTQARMHPTGLNGRLAFGAAYRLPTGATDDPNDFTNIGTGTHAPAIGLRGYVDLLMGQHFWTSFVARYDNELGSDITIRVPDGTTNGYLPVYRRAMVHRTLGNLLAMEMTPRWVFNDFVSVSAHYAYRHKPVDQYTGTPFTVGPTPATGETTITIDPSSAGANTNFTEQRVGGGFAFSNLAAVQRGQASFPFEVMFLHFQTIKGTGGNVPKLFADQIQLRFYTKLFGR